MLFWTICWGSAVAARAALVGPGQTVLVSDPFVEPTGVLERTETRPFFLTFAAPDGLTFDEGGTQTTLAQTASFRQRVFSDLATDALTFTYELTIESPMTTESVRINASTFFNMTTDVSGTIGTAGSFEASRTADGAAVSAFTPDGTAGAGGDNLLVLTNAVDFSRGGEVTFEVIGEFTLYDALGNVTPGNSLSAAATLDDTFRPLLGDAPPPPPPPPVIPLPAAVWPGMIGLAALAVRLRRTGG